METELTALLAVAATVIVGLLGFVTVLMRRNHKGNPNGVSNLSREMHSRFDRLEDKMERQVDRIVDAMK